MRRLLSVALLSLLSTTAIAAGTEKKSSAAEEGLARTHEAFFSAWNKHDIKAMMTCWADDATLINPMGRTAHGKAEVEAVLTDEHNTMFKASTATVVDMKVTRSLGPNMVLFDGTLMLDGAVASDGSAMPQLKFHLTGVAEKRGSNWVFLDARPYQFITPPPAKTD